MTDVDIFAKLSRILETHAVSGDGDDDESVMELLQKLERDGNNDDKFAGSASGKRNKGKR